MYSIFDSVFETKAFLRACKKLLNATGRTELKHYLLEKRTQET